MLEERDRCEMILEMAHAEAPLCFFSRSKPILSLEVKAFEGRENVMEQTRLFEADAGSLQTNEEIKFSELEPIRE